jgi:hypothetical protein
LKLVGRHLRRMLQWFLLAIGLIVLPKILLPMGLIQHTESLGWVHTRHRCLALVRNKHIEPLGMARQLLRRSWLMVHIRRVELQVRCRNLSMSLGLGCVH